MDMWFVLHSAGEANERQRWGMNIIEAQHIYV
jgi:hypothetical protein